MVLRAWNLSIQEAEAEGSKLQGHPGLLSEFKASLGNFMKSVSK